MNKILLIATAIFSINANAQLGDLFGKKNKGKVEVETRSLAESAKDWEDGTFRAWRPNSGLMEPIGNMSLKFVKDASGEVTSIFEGAETMDDKYKDQYTPYSYGGTAHIDAFFMNSMHVMYISKETIIGYGLGSDYEPNRINFVLGKKVGNKKAFEIINTYRKNGSSKVEDDRENLKANEIAHRKEFTLEGKEVVEIKAVWPKGEPKSLNEHDNVKVGFEIKLKSGEVWKTANVGGEAYIEDLKVEAVNGHFYGLGGEYTVDQYGGYDKSRGMIRASVRQYSSDDNAVFEISSKFGGAGKTTIKLPIVYDDNLDITFNGQDAQSMADWVESAGLHAGNGAPLEIEVLKEKHSVTGIEIYAVKCKEGFSGNYYFYKFAATGKLNISVNGGQGGAGGHGRDKDEDDSGVPGNGMRGGNGGNAGLIALTLDPSAKDLEYSYSNRPGQGGSGGRNGSCSLCPAGSGGTSGASGKSGNEGTFNKEIKAVSL